jgi:pyruvate dehydrogenase E2 component (dihydrolipoamide acetyltransferase)
MRISQTKGNLMSTIKKITIPPLGNKNKVPVIEVNVSPGDMVAQDEILLAVESSKAIVEVPSPVSGKIIEMLVDIGDTVIEGDLVGTIEEV